MYFFKFISKLITLCRSFCFLIISGNKKLIKFRLGKNSKIINPTSISVGKKVNIGENAVINCHENDKRIHLQIFNNVYIGRDVQINAYSSVVIESNVVIADRVYVSDATHNYNDLNKPIIDQGTSFTGEVRIGEGSWLGINCVVLPGVRIGKNVIVAANSVVSKDVEDYSIVGGVPAKLIKKQK